MKTEVIVINFLVGIFLFTLVFYFFLSLPIETSLIFSSSLSAIFDLAYILSKKLRKRDRTPIEKSVAKVKLSEPFIVVGATATSFLIGVEILTAFAVGGFFFIIYQLYYNNLPHLYKLSSNSIAIRQILVFLSFLLAWYRFWNFDLLLSVILGTFGFILIEIDRKTVVELYKMKLVTEKDLENTAKKVAMIPGLVFGSVAGVLLAKGTFTVDAWKEALPEMLKLYPFFILLWFSIFLPIHWLRIHGHRKKL